MINSPMTKAAAYARRVVNADTAIGIVVAKAATALHLAKGTLYNKIKKYRLNAEEH